MLFRSKTSMIKKCNMLGEGGGGGGCYMELPLQHMCYMIQYQDLLSESPVNL